MLVIKIPSIPNYSTINRRINNQDIRISERHEVGNDDDIIIALIVQESKLLIEVNGYDINGT